MTAPLLDARGLTRHFQRREGLRRLRPVVAVDGIDLTLREGEAYGLVGESGSGKSTVARLILRLLETTGGEIRFQGKDITDLRGEALLKLRESIQIVFQDPHASLNPRKTILFSVSEPLVVHRGLKGPALRARVEELLQIVGLSGAYLYRYPHELSGGQKQRVCIARAVALDPKLLVLDEPTSALDVSVQAEILNLLGRLRREHGLTYILVSHNLAVIAQMCDRLAVMNAGRVVEEMSVAQLRAAEPTQPYTRQLLTASRGYDRAAAEAMESFD